MTWPATWRPLAHARCAWWRQRQKDQRSELSVLYLFCAKSRRVTHTKNIPKEIYILTKIMKKIILCQIIIYCPRLKELHNDIVSFGYADSDLEVSI